MSLTNYSDLIAAVPNWMARADLTARIPEFISLAESDFNAELRTNSMIVNIPNFIIGAEYVDWPAGFAEMRDWYINGNPRRPLTFMPDDTMTSYYNSSDIPKYFTMSGKQFRLAPAPNGNISTTLRYYQTIPGLQTNTTNWLMTARPNLYLFAVNLQAALFIQDADQIQRWLPAYQAELQLIKDASKRTRYSGTGMAVRAL